MSFLLLESDPSGSADDSPWWLQKLDDLSIRVSDWVNPILVKETRQALKSRQFLITFSLLLIAALGWTVIGSLMQMPQIYSSPTAPYMLVGYYLVLAVPMLLVVPLAAYRSLESELDDGTLELLSISVLSPWQIVLGKLASAALQMTLYFVALFPCVAFAYTLRGVDLPTLATVMGFLFLSGILVTILALAFAPLARSRGGRVLIQLVVLAVLLIGEYMIGVSCIGMLLYGIPFEPQLIVFSTVFLIIATLMLGNLLLTSTAMMLTPESENRSTRLRLSLALLTAVMSGLIAFGVQSIDAAGVVVGMGVTTYVILGLLWLLAATMFVAESPTLTPRVRRELPGSFAGRLLWTFLTPGPATGLVFGCVGLACTCIAAYQSIVLLSTESSVSGVMTQPELDLMRGFLMLFCGYSVVYLVLSRWCIALVRRWQSIRVEVGIAVFVVIALIFSLTPYSVALYQNETFTISWSYGQITNFGWTMYEFMDSKLPESVPMIVATSAVVLFFASLLISCGVTLPRRIMLPERVARERDLEKQVVQSAEADF